MGSQAVSIGRVGIAMDRTSRGISFFARSWAAGFLFRPASTSLHVGEWHALHAAGFLKGATGRGVAPAAAPRPSFKPDP